MRMKILLLVSSFNGLTQRAWCALREAGHDVSVELAIDEQTIISGEKAADPAFTPTSLATAGRPVPGTGLQPTLRQADCAFDWDDEADSIVRHIRAADGFPGCAPNLRARRCTRSTPTSPRRLARPG
jgi:hypothetical protein